MTTSFANNKFFFRFFGSARTRDGMWWVVVVVVVVWIASFAHGSYTVGNSRAMVCYRRSSEMI